MASPVVHFQIHAKGVEEMSAFYRDVFGWRISPRSLTSVELDAQGTYPYIEAEDGGIAGGISAAVEGKSENVLVVEVDDIEATLRKVEALGGRRRHPGTEPESMVLGGAETQVSFDLAEFEDPEGNLVEIIHR